MNGTIAFNRLNVFRGQLHLIIYTYKLTAPSCFLSLRGNTEKQLAGVQYCSSKELAQALLLTAQKSSAKILGTHRQLLPASARLSGCRQPPFVVAI